MFGQVLNMKNFQNASGVQGISDPVLTGLLTSILELGAWVGVLANGILADRLGRKLCVVVACVLFTIGVIIQACTSGGSYSYILAGRFVTGLGVGSLSMIVPLYNAELSPPEIRGSLVALQQVCLSVLLFVCISAPYVYCNIVCSIYYLSVNASASVIQFGDGPRGTRASPRVRAKHTINGPRSLLSTVSNLPTRLRVCSPLWVLRLCRRLLLSLKNMLIILLFLQTQSLLQLCHTK
jgi:MFS family permease